MVKCQEVIQLLIVRNFVSINCNSKRKQNATFSYFKGENYKTTKISKDLFKSITGFLKRDYFEMITASKAVTCTSQKPSTTDQRHSCHSSLPKKQKNKPQKCLQSQDWVKVGTIRFCIVFCTLFLPSIAERQSVGVCTPCTCLLAQLPLCFCTRFITEEL